MNSDNEIRNDNKGNEPCEHDEEDLEFQPMPYCPFMMSNMGPAMSGEYSNPNTMMMPSYDDDDSDWEDDSDDSDEYRHKHHHHHRRPYYPCFYHNCHKHGNHHNMPWWWMY
ncbi:hypothetical protein ACJDT4_11680 [Clostridium neuense]|uniref:Uncharacterized protein n=1 Tax=Clostridium neuense TaxID=1728934 RepID=A0ABW8TGF7_9CLOT